MNERTFCVTTLLCDVFIKDIYYLKYQQKNTNLMNFITFLNFADFLSAYRVIQYYRNCQEDSQLVLDYATFHIFFPNDHKPQTVNNLTFSCDDILTDPLEWKSYRNSLLLKKKYFVTYILTS